MYWKILSILVFINIPFFNFSQIEIEEDSIRLNINHTQNVEPKTTLYFSGQYYNAFRTIEDNSANQSFDSLKLETPVSTGGVELGTYIVLNKNFWLSIGVNYFGGGESWAYVDSISDSTYRYINKYRQVALPIRFNYGFGNKIKWYSFIGAIPSSILGRRYESSFTTEKGILTKNDIEVFEANINSFQFIGTVGTGISYDFGQGAIFGDVAYRRYFTSTYTGIFLRHQQWLIGGNIGASFRF